jgi:pyruvate ferredoxin oxidoreductase alpha subunit
VERSTRGLPYEIKTVIAGLGGRAITRNSLRKVFKQAMDGSLEPLTFLDLEIEVVEKQLARERSERHTGPLPEAIVREVAEQRLGG